MSRRPSAASSRHHACVRACTRWAQDFRAAGRVPLLRRRRPLLPSARASTDSAVGDPLFNCIDRLLATTARVSEAFVSSHSLSAPRPEMPAVVLGWLCCLYLSTYLSSSSSSSGPMSVRSFVAQSIDGEQPTAAKRPTFSLSLSRLTLSIPIRLSQDCLMVSLCHMYHNQSISYTFKNMFMSFVFFLTLHRSHNDIHEFIVRNSTIATNGLR